MELLEAIHARRAVREFVAEPVSSAALERLINAAIQAPSAVNRQPWLFTVVRNQELLRRISEASKKHMLTTLAADAEMHGFREHLSNPDFDIFYHAPALIIISAATDDGWAAEDATLAAQNLMLAACAEGLGTCWIGFAQRWLDTEEGRRIIDLPADFRPIAPVIVGHPKGSLPPVLRKPPAVRWIG